MDYGQDKELVVDVKFKIRDVLRYNMSVMLKRNMNKVILLIGLLLMGFYIYKLINREVTLDLFIAQNIVLLLVPILIFLLIPWKVWKITISQMQVPAFAYGVTYIFSKDKIILDLGEVKDEIAWDTFIKIIETKKDIRFFVDEYQAQLIPKHNLTKEQMNLFRTLAAKAANKDVYQLKKM
ncbi:MAG: YcxB family protein [Clostridia bacterium]|jgi:hypothetical protein|nr:YcxB family protein [Clostridia bacterium]